VEVCFTLNLEERKEEKVEMLMLTVTYRTVLFGAFIASGYVPMVHNYYFYGSEGLVYFPLTAALVMNALDFLGAVFYVTRFPESRFPEKYDIWVRKISRYIPIHLCDTIRN
jgi:hypothetical protein